MVSSLTPHDVKHLSGMMMMQLKQPSVVRLHRSPGIFSDRCCDVRSARWIVQISLFTRVVLLTGLSVTIRDVHGLRFGNRGNEKRSL